MQTHQTPLDYSLVPGQSQHQNSESAPILRRQVAFCGSVDLGGKDSGHNIQTNPLKTIATTINPYKRYIEEGDITHLNIHAGQPPLRCMPPNRKPLVVQQRLSHEIPSTNQTNCQPNKPSSFIPNQDRKPFSRMKCSKAEFVESLVDVSATIIESIWPNHSASTKTKILPLKEFIRETLQRSKTSFSTLQTALFYLFRARDLIRSDSLDSPSTKIGHVLSGNSFVSTVDIEDGFANHSTAPPLPSPPLTPAQAVSRNNHQKPHLPTNETTSTSCGPLNPIFCARRMFLAALIAASKFLQDKNYSNKAWSKITGLPPSEINLNEISLLSLLDYRLFITPVLFSRWSAMLISHINHSQLARNAKATPGNTDTAVSTGITAATNLGSGTHHLVI
ncbi:hypothetical protein K493DRAFT_98407 [Basidiobolus meristosporus CBS 931.73]|uniref:Cyclin-domain-containing protein n=1 Tax=Basidiobolus meristosporus CBS 931.73 TaxID=1314790 RepID=A0A1Y1X3H6_9FUNG|nr:hypothetical protein K493DRAFT_98407 [Basidiobolus meristosporus CBS 931.73]|eukprot:ORX80252.1 hypothetical protein K493DRAFT_98407 [Basidiobolus meristosporus CBS 931.73]